MIEAEGSPAERSVQEALGRYRSLLMAYETQRGVVYRRLTNDGGLTNRPLRLDEVRRLESAAIEVRDALREFLR